MLKKEEHEKILSEILENARTTNLEEITNKLQKLREEYDIDFKEFESNKTSIAELSKNNEKLRIFNMELFNKIPTGTEEKKKEEEHKKEVDEQRQKDEKFDNFIKEFI